MKHLSKYYAYFRIQLKTSFSYIPKLIISIVCFALLLSGFAFAGSRLLYSSKSFTVRVNVALVVYDDNPLINLAVYYIKNLKSVDDICEFVVMEEVTAYDKLEKGEVYAVVVLPEGFIKDIQNGRNTPANVILQPDAGADSVLFETLAEAAAYTLRTAQSGIYASINILSRFNRNDLGADMLDKLNNRYIKLSLRRSSMFLNNELSATEAVSITQFYTAAAFVLLLLLSGIGCASLFEKNTVFLSLLIKRNNIGYFAQTLLQILSVGISYFFVFLVFVIPYTIIFSNLGIVKSFIISLFTFFMTELCVCSFSMMIFRLSKNAQTGILFISLLSITMLFASGGIIPAAFLPELLGTIGSFLPTTYWLSSVINVSSCFYIGPILASCGFLAIFIFVNYILLRTETR